MSEKQRMTRRKQLAFRLSLAVGIGFVVVSAYWFWSSFSAEPNRQRVEISADVLTAVKQRNAKVDRIVATEQVKKSVTNLPNDAVFYKTASVQDLQLLAYELGGWELWLHAFKAGSIKVDDLTEQEQDRLFELAAAQLTPALLEELLQYGFRVTEKSEYVVINGSTNLAAHEQIVLEKIRLIDQYRSLDSDKTQAELSLAKQGAFYRAAAFGYRRVFEFLVRDGISVENSHRLFETMLRGRQPSSELFYYLLELGYQPSYDLLDLACRRGLHECHQARIHK
ncbi:hypothetical protein [Pseudidiomarina sp. YC-516-91]|uniref:hypothetical protein n=1 Tax=Pseudidiomarina salilacus TaxID=3384452 RepID=UPI003984B747